MCAPFSNLRRSRTRRLGASGRAVLVATLLVATVAPLQAQVPNQGQNPGQGPGQNFQNAPAAPFAGPNIGFGIPNFTSGQGGAANADFESLIDLIVSTVSTETWAENGGGEAEIRPFPGGVMVDAAGTLQLRGERTNGLELRLKRGKPPASNSFANSSPVSTQARKSSALRFVSLPRLEREIARRQAAGERLEPAMLTLAGLERVQYIFVYPETGDLVLAGPAGDWRIDQEGHIVSTVTGAPVVRLDDLLVLLRRGNDSAHSFFGCSINPRQEALEKAQLFLASTSGEPLQAGARKKWLSDLRDSVGEQDIEVFGVDPTSRVAGVLVAADYHMKLIGMGLEEGVEGVESYLDSIRLARGESPPAMSVLRWWFALNYETVRSTDEENAFELVGQGVRVLSENEMLAARGERVHTGQSDPLNRKFAEAFTQHFDELAAKYPVYVELRNVFDLAMAVAIIESNGLAEKAGWEPSLFVTASQLRLPTGPVPRQVETVIAHRVIQRRHIVAGVSGGVMVAPGDVLSEPNATTQSAGGLRAKHAASQIDASDGAWWWDAVE